MPQWHTPLDPDCPTVASYFEQLNNPEDYIIGAPYDDIIDGFERRHRVTCKRCQMYGAANIEVA